MGDYLKLSGTDKGLPRGIGISAYLSGIYLAYIDAEVRRHNEIFYYSRYVDDMIIMFAPEKRRQSMNIELPSPSCLPKKAYLLMIELNLMNEQRGKFTYLG